MKQKKQLLIPEESRKVLRREFAQLIDDVKIILFTDDKDNKPFNEYSVNLLSELAETTAKIKPVFEKITEDTTQKYGVSRTPTILVQPDKYNIRFTGAPAGEETRTLLLSIIMASTGSTIFSEQSNERLADLRDKRAIKVFVSPTCPYCPQQAALAISAAIRKPDLVSAEMIEIYENRDLASQYGAVSVPQTFVNDQLVAPGLQPEEVFVEEVITAAPVQVKETELHEGTEKDVVIIGAGPAGLTAAIYTERSGLKSIVIEKANIGGQVAVTPVVENYPAFTRIAGKTLMDMMAQQAINYTDIHDGEEVLDIMKKDDVFEVITNKARYSAKAVLIAAGVESKKLDVPGEKQYQGRGVSYCAACDGYFFKDGKKVIVVGGGNTAATEALYLKNIGVDVTVVHRRDKLRAEQILQQSLADNRIPIIWNSIVNEIKGEKLVTHVVLENLTNKSVSTLNVDGVFIAIGYVPNNELANKLGVDTDEEGYVKVDHAHRTNVPGIYAAGDITGGFKQIVTAVGQGAAAAMSIFEDISHPYWINEKH
ncbi:FAD-dependent pyridine nucleotide-disulphide oxidoreductase [Candidatus Sulfobium mesophilum]|uniref:Thioredoxin reductase n=1 Tax=Candidatus Sulfobium mesophilum TaxID=2016548 RepID=A0A2U3QEY8_9BACT|nr:FAD-dependent pyridine nucleotide-disulphide oxidoreductase [Candidatus Sulfobium mesophilum]